MSPRSTLPSPHAWRVHDGPLAPRLLKKCWSGDVCVVEATARAECPGTVLDSKLPNRVRGAVTLSVSKADQRNAVRCYAPSTLGYACTTPYTCVVALRSSAAVQRKVAAVRDALSARTCVTSGDALITPSYSMTSILPLNSVDDIVLITIVHVRWAAHSPPICAGRNGRWTSTTA